MKQEMNTVILTVAFIDENTIFHSIKRNVPILSYRSEYQRSHFLADSDSFRVKILTWYPLDCLPSMESVHLKSRANITFFYILLSFLSPLFCWRSFVLSIEVCFVLHYFFYVSQDSRAQRLYCSFLICYSCFYSGELRIYIIWAYCELKCIQTTHRGLLQDYATMEHP